MSAAKRRLKAIKRRRWVTDLREDRCRWDGHFSMIHAFDHVQGRAGRFFRNRAMLDLCSVCGRWAK